MTHMVALARYYDVEEALVVRGFLDSNNIMTTLMGEHHLSVESYLRIGLGGFRILVPSGQLSEAIKLLNGDIFRAPLSQMRL